ncbi:Hypothetical predicted protein [Octopus vulgaris]|uniref:Uncharacterized protein n=1 Tax=Octopus vulgaris TaxID=6645 RepID=A0AA36B356_OCTVU|nr:Hypothetical predicted protein [Octopus vulgaris]
MSLKRRLTAIEETQIAAGLTEGLSVGELAKELGRDTRTLMMYVENSITKPEQDKDFHFCAIESRMLHRVCGTTRQQILQVQ